MTMRRLMAHEDRAATVSPPRVSARLAAILRSASNVIVRCAPTNPLYKACSREAGGSMAVLFVSHGSGDDTMAVAL